jgi:IclR family KDG regulon transcriptional repressor
MPGDGATDPDEADAVATVGATETSFAIVEQLASRPAGAEITALASELDVSKSTVYNHLQTLRELGYVVKRDGEYFLGLQFLTVGDSARARTGLYPLVKDETDALVEAVGERAQVMVEERGRGIYIYQAKADQGIQTDSHIGMVVSLNATAVGKAYLAHLDEDERRRVLDAMSFQEQTPNTRTDREQLLTEFDEIRDRGYAFNDEERTVGMRAVGAPIVVNDGEDVVGAISVSGPTTRMTGDWYREDVPERVRQAARVISIRATYP